jgi:hypothetical protein
MSTNNAVEQTNKTVVVPFAPLGFELKGQIWKDDTGVISVSIPGGRNFGGIFTAKLETADINGRQVAISGSYDADGLKRMEAFDGVVKTSYHRFLSNPNANMVDTLIFGNGVQRTVRWANEAKKTGKGPVASYYLSI